jgi:hypothetical protein
LVRAIFAGRNSQKIEVSFLILNAVKQDSFRAGYYPIGYFRYKSVLFIQNCAGSYIALINLFLLASYYFSRGRAPDQDAAFRIQESSNGSQYRSFHLFSGSGPRRIRRKRFEFQFIGFYF